MDTAENITAATHKIRSLRTSRAGYDVTDVHHELGLMGDTWQQQVKLFSLRHDIAHLSNAVTALAVTGQ